MTDKPVKMQPPQGLERFLARSGWRDADISPVAGDASFRRYFRATRADGRRAIIMDAPPPHEDPRPFIRISRALTEYEIRAPKILGEDLENGLVLIEDFGDNRMREFLDANPDREYDVYRRAIDLLVRMKDLPVLTLPPYDIDAYMREVMLLVEWYMPAMRLPDTSDEYERYWRDLLQEVSTEAHRNITVLRDYHAENIMLLDDGDQGVIDFQDALVGHPAYDLVSLLQDARRDVSTELETEMLRHYKRQIATGPEFDRHYALLGAQRNIKIIGIFTRLWKRDGKAHYLEFLPRMWRYLEHDLAHPDLAIMKDWFDRNIPQDIRSKSPTEFAGS